MWSFYFMSACGSPQIIIPINKTYNISQHVSWSATIMSINIANQFSVLRVRLTVNTNTVITRKESLYRFFCGWTSLGIHLWPIVLMNTDWKIFWKDIFHINKKYYFIYFWETSYFYKKSTWCLHYVTVRCYCLFSH